MLHDIINEQENCLDVRDDISEKKWIFFTGFHKNSLASGALTLEIIVIADNKPMHLCSRCYKNKFHLFPNTYRIPNNIYKDTIRK